MAEIESLDNHRRPNNELYSAVGVLAMRLSHASRDTGLSYFVSLEPINPDLPDEYRVEIIVRRPDEPA